MKARKTRGGLVWTLSLPGVEQTVSVRLPGPKWNVEILGPASVGNPDHRTGHYSRLRRVAAGKSRQDFLPGGSRV
jgi:hypothetical protein